MDLENIGLQLKEERKRQGLTQAQAGSLAGLDDSIISRIEHGRYQGSLKGYRRYLSSLGFQLAVEKVTPARPQLDDLRGMFDDD
ncbi:helix-turn-helix transcriptional regulator [Thalassotalea sp. G20_0]|uniref:helix-turn-helix transcriptional regulator n=1 Tax=Thalassotalea sp. G20_0 TaxID=2821093 RepID=UPI001ADCFD15|nr:helix-turn-helix transcriptional regulator [Thalassotalea sp. G20_0]MBO9495602.1 helix-turn-helix transcriptional regulator [Thalassotalea sp. G20_0]